MKVLITGAAGFIGTNFVYYMLQKYPDYQIIGFDALTYASNINNLDKAMENPNFRFIEGNICNKEAVNKLFREEAPDIVVNFAAESHVDRSIDDPQLFLKNNVIGVGILLDTSVKYKVKRFHQISTDEVYGDLPLDKLELKFTEDSPLRPSSPYSASKASADLLVMAYHRTYRLNVTISRSSNNFGPYQHVEKLIPKTIHLASQNKPIPVYGNGMNIRDWIYVDDHCKAVDMIIHHGRNGEIYNVGANNEISNIALIKIILRLMDKPENLITYVTDRKGHDLRYALDITKLTTELGFKLSKEYYQQKLIELISSYKTKS